jgi:hypothetical protein
MTKPSSASACDDCSLSRVRRTGSCDAAPRGTLRGRLLLVPVLHSVTAVTARGSAKRGHAVLQTNWTVAWIAFVVVIALLAAIAAGLFRVRRR